MSLFRRPKKANVQRRVFSAMDDEDEDHSKKSDSNELKGSGKNGDNIEKMDVDERVKTPPPPTISQHKYEKKIKEPPIEKKSSKKTSLLSFGDEGIYSHRFSVFFCLFHSSTELKSILLKFCFFSFCRGRR